MQPRVKQWQLENQQKTGMRLRRKWTEQTRNKYEERRVRLGNESTSRRQENVKELDTRSKPDNGETEPRRRRKRRWRRRRRGRRRAKSRYIDNTSMVIDPTRYFYFTIT